MTRKPPHPTDLNTPIGSSDVDKCQYCLKLVEDEYRHYGECGERKKLTEVMVNNEFGIVVPEKSGYLWITKTDAFANRHVNVQGTYIPVGQVRSVQLNSRNDIDFPIDLGKLNLDESENSKELRRIIKKGVRQSSDYNYGFVDLGEKLVEERLDGVYADDEEVQEKKLETRDERIQSVWEEIDAELPFEYERVAAPEGYPRTREGMRWINITGHNHPDYADTDTEKAIFREPWVENLTNEGSVAFYYPNSD